MQYTELYDPLLRGSGSKFCISIKKRGIIMKRVQCIALSLALLLTMTACSTGGKSGGTDDNKPQQNPASDTHKVDSRVKLEDIDYKMPYDTDNLEVIKERLMAGATSEFTGFREVNISDVALLCNLYLGGGEYISEREYEYIEVSDETGGVKKKAQVTDSIIGHGADYNILEIKINPETGDIWSVHVNLDGGGDKGLAKIIFTAYMGSELADRLVNLPSAETSADVTPGWLFTETINGVNYSFNHVMDATYTVCMSDEITINDVTYYWSEVAGPGEGLLSSLSALLPCISADYATHNFSVTQADIKAWGAENGLDTMYTDNTNCSYARTNLILYWDRGQLYFRHYGGATLQGVKGDDGTLSEESISRSAEGVVSANGEIVKVTVENWK